MVTVKDRKSRDISLWETFRKIGLPFLIYIVIIMLSYLLAGNIDTVCGITIICSAFLIEYYVVLYLEGVKERSGGE